MHYFSVEEIGRDRTMPTTPMALLSALDRNGLRNPDYFRSSTYLFTSNLPLVSTSTSKCYRPTASIPPCHTFRDWRNNAWLIASSLRFYHRSLRDLPISRPSVHIFFPLRLHDIILLSPIFSIHLLLLPFASNFIPQNIHPTIGCIHFSIPTPVLPRFSLLTLYNRTIGRIGKFRRASDNDRWSPVLCYTPAV